jgi:hypothetical protein
MKTLRGRRKDRLKLFTQNSPKGKGHWISYIYCKRLNLLLRNVNDLTTTIGMCREESKAGTLSKHLEEPHSHSEQNQKWRPKYRSDAWVNPMKSPKAVAFPPPTTAAALL